MKQYRSVVLAIVVAIPLLVSAAAAFAADAGSVTIIAPHDGAVLASGVNNELQYNVHLGPSGNHLHVYVDDMSPMIVRNVDHCPCSLDLPQLSPGVHTIAVREATAGHALTGVESFVTVTVK